MIIIAGQIKSFDPKFEKFKQSAIDNFKARINNKKYGLTEKNYKSKKYYFDLENSYKYYKDLKYRSEAQKVYAESWIENYKRWKKKNKFNIIANKTNKIDFRNNKHNLSNLNINKMARYKNKKSIPDVVKYFDGLKVVRIKDNDKKLKLETGVMYSKIIGDKTYEILLFKSVTGKTLSIADVDNKRINNTEVYYLKSSDQNLSRKSKDLIDKLKIDDSWRNSYVS